jgi:hypothetical protein
MVVFLSEHDNLVDSLRVHDYLLDKGIDSRLMTGIDHAGFLLLPSWLNQIVDQVTLMCASADLAAEIETHLVHRP